MNILFVVGCFAKNETETALGGMANAVYKSAIGMQRIGHKVVILTIAKEDKRWNYHGVDIVSIKVENGIGKKYIINGLLAILRREYRIEKAIASLHKERTIDVIQYAGWFGIGLLHFSKIPAVMRISSYAKWVGCEYPDKVVWLLSNAEYYAAKRMDYIFAPSRVMAQNIQKNFKKNVDVIETPYLQEQLILDESVLRAQCKNIKYIFFFGRMSEDKGILVIKDILYKILEKYQDVHFAFAGSSGGGNRGEKIEEILLKASKQYSSRVIFLGLLPQNQLVPVISNAEMILMPSLSDNFPNTCAEAMALGKIVIGTDGSSLEQFIMDGENGFLAEIGSADSLCECVERVLNMNDEQKKIISKYAKERIEKLDLVSYSKKMERLYEKVIMER